MKFGAEEAVQADHEAMLRVSEADQLLSKAKFEVLLQERRAETAVQSSQRQKQALIPAARFHLMHEVEELKENSCFQTERTQELPKKTIWRTKMRESQSAVDQLTVQIEELQEPTEYLNDARDF